MDLFKRRRAEWIKRIKAGEGGAGTGVGDGKGEVKELLDGKGRKTEWKKGHKTAIELAREKFAKEKVKKERLRHGKGTGANVEVRNTKS